MALGLRVGCLLAPAGPRPGARPPWYSRPLEIVNLQIVNLWKIVNKIAQTDSAIQADSKLEIVNLWRIAVMSAR